MNRRNLLAGGAAALPLAVAGVSTAAPVEIPTVYNPLDRVTRLARELSEALAEWNGELFGGGPWIARVYPAGSRSHPISLEDTSAPWSPIRDLFDQWQQTRRDCNKPKTDAEVEVIYAEYLRLQQEIIDSVPRTLADLAMQFYVDTDGNESQNSPQFVGQLLTLAGVEAVRS